MSSSPSMVPAPVPDRPANVIWDITYACPLRCVHCYSESGRRPSRQLDRTDLLRVSDAIISLRPGSVALAGGEPFLVREIFDVARRITRRGIPVIIYTGGWSLTPQMVEAGSPVMSEIIVSIDGATAEVHDRIRGRVGSHDRAMEALSLLNRAAREARTHGRRPLPFGVDYVVTRSNLHQVGDFCAAVAPRFPELGFLTFGAVVPTGLASRPGFVDAELLTDEEADRLGSPDEARRLRLLAPASVRVTCSDNRTLQMHPDQVAAGTAFPTMQVEPDGAVRAMPIYEGTVGNLLTDPPGELWRRAVARWSDPFVVKTLAPVGTFAQWAEATRRIDRHFGSPEVRTRIAQRLAYPTPRSGGLMIGAVR